MDFLFFLLGVATEVEEKEQDRRARKLLGPIKPLAPPGIPELVETSINMIDD